MESNLFKKSGFSQVIPDNPDMCWQGMSQLTHPDIKRLVCSYKKSYIVSMEFEWDDQKLEKNIKNHGVDFISVIPLFQSGSSVYFEDNRKDYGEKRLILMGELKGHLFQVAFTVRGEKIRIISARRGNKRERKIYEQKKNDTGGPNS
jgi:uncharacterized DUF497 family protein